MKSRLVSVTLFLAASCGLALLLDAVAISVNARIPDCPHENALLAYNEPTPCTAFTSVCASWNNLGAAACHDLGREYDTPQDLVQSGTGNDYPTYCSVDPVNCKKKHDCVYSIQQSTCSKFLFLEWVQANQQITKCCEGDSTTTSGSCPLPE
jgi:hypothetical protein